MSALIEQTAASGVRGEWVCQNVTLTASAPYTFDQHQIDTLESSSLIIVICNGSRPWTNAGQGISWLSGVIPGVHYKALASSSSNTTTVDEIRGLAMYHDKIASVSDTYYLGIYAVY